MKGKTFFLTPLLEVFFLIGHPITSFLPSTACSPSLVLCLNPWFLLSLYWLYLQRFLWRKDKVIQLNEATPKYLNKNLNKSEKFEKFQGLNHRNWDISWRKFQKLKKESANSFKVVPRYQYQDTNTYQDTKGTQSPNRVYFFFALYQNHQNHQNLCFFVRLLSTI